MKQQIELNFEFIKENCQTIGDIIKLEKEVIKWNTQNN